MYRAVVYQICIGMYRAVHSVSPGRVLYIGCLGLISTMGFICFHGLLYGGGVLSGLQKGLLQATDTEHMMVKAMAKIDYRSML